MASLHLIQVSEHGYVGESTHCYGQGSIVAVRLTGQCGLNEGECNLWVARRRWKRRWKRGWEKVDKIEEGKRVRKEREGC